VWNEGWRAKLDGSTHILRAASDGEGFGVELELDGEASPVLHGNAGFSQKGAEPGNASHYYSLTRMPTRGRIMLDGQPIDVSGSSWMDHEFGTSFLEPGQQGWDWFSLQLDDGTDVMVYVLRHRDGSVDARSAGTIVGGDGSGTIALTADDYRLVPGRIWVSPSSGARYPVEWQIDVPSAGLSLAVRATIDGQELHTDQSTGVTYWEGAVDAVGSRAGEPIVGRGYLEMTGYSGAPMSEVLR
jgi:predicted secreted hydrolase